MGGAFKISGGVAQVFNWQAMLDMQLSARTRCLDWLNLGGRTKLALDEEMLALKLNTAMFS